MRPSLAIWRSWTATLEQRERADIPALTVELVAGLVAGMRLVGRPQ